MEFDTHEPWECPRCHNIFVGHPAVSRLSTPAERIYVCSDCGIVEAIEVWRGVLTDWRNNEPVPQEIF